MSSNGHTTIELPGSVTVRELADLIKASPIDIIKKLMSSGMMATINQMIDYDPAAIVVSEFGFEAQLADHNCRGVIVDHLIDGRHHAARHQLLDYVNGA